ncbi:MAG: glucosamine--fructose-6-phosphate aminotransferase (isomerizing) [Francisellaceae bacterium]|jgi:glucosamine--fructose-6-phosphate aminotransferase (isomerizing)
MAYTKTIMEKEALSVPEKIEKQLKENKKLWTDICLSLKKRDLKYAVTIARGSSDHAATFAKYLFEVEMDLVTSSAAPSVYTIYNRKFTHNGGLIMGLSQSGKSPDLFETIAKATKAGAPTISLVNQVNSPLADASEFVVPLHADTEVAVAATKSYIATLVALIQFSAIYTNNTELLNALEQLPESLASCGETNWDSVINSLEKSQNAYIIGRGFSFPIAQEAALKLKETSSLHAEAFSSAEVLHGPFALVKKQFPAIIFGQNDEALPGVIELTKRMTEMGARTFLCLPDNGSKHSQNIVCSSRLPMPKSLHPRLDPLMSIQAFYIMAARLAIKRGLNPDAPDNLKKVTETR